MKRIGAALLLLALLTFAMGAAAPRGPTFTTERSGYSFSFHAHTAKSPAAIRTTLHYVDAEGHKVNVQVWEVDHDGAADGWIVLAPDAKVGKFKIDVLRVTGESAERTY